MTKSESKYFNTAMRMDEALLSLLEKKDLPYITVKEICEKAEVNRSTFYLHYETIDDLLSESIEYMHTLFRRQFTGREDIAGRIRHCPKEELLLLTPEYLRPYLEFVRRHRTLYQAALEKPQLFAADEAYRQLFQTIFDPILERFGVPVHTRVYRMQFYLNGISGVIAEWLRHKCADDTDTIIDIICQCAMPMELTLPEV